MTAMYIGDAVALGHDVEAYELEGEGDYYEVEGDEPLAVMGAGYDEIIGDELIDLSGDEPNSLMLEALGLEQEIIGADPRRRRVVRRVAARPQARQIIRRVPSRLPQQAAMARAAGGVLVKAKQPQNARVQVLPIGPRNYLAAETADVEMRPQRTMRIQRVAFNSLISPFFQINSLMVGQDPQFVAAGSVPAEIFNQVGVGMSLKGSTANLGTTVVIGATNTDAVNPRQLSGGILGPTVY